MKTKNIDLKEFTKLCKEAKENGWEIGYYSEGNHLKIFWFNNDFKSFLESIEGDYDAINFCDKNCSNVSGVAHIDECSFKGINGIIGDHYRDLTELNCKEYEAIINKEWKKWKNKFKWIENRKLR